MTTAIEAANEISNHGMHAKMNTVVFIVKQELPDRKFHPLMQLQVGSGQFYTV